MKKALTILLLLMATVAVPAQKKPVVYNFTEASSLTMVGKLMTDTPNPYHRVDTVRFKGFTTTENKQVRMSAGLAVAFRTDSKTIAVRTKYLDRGFPANTGGLAARGYDLYIRQDGKWLWAASNASYDQNPENDVTLINSMDGSMHECLMYLPILSEVESVKIGTDEGSVIEPIANPFRHRVGIFGSSFTQCVQTLRF